ncbi:MULTISPECIES: hypothetical protein [Bradyrhizobium]|uniref:hypothetical protein n=1 Tax=Bradyrhizobium TaxID=374 RepID=UPI001FDF50AF|nr:MULTISPECIES: hypothetical protein [Bradyrhizobium]
MAQSTPSGGLQSTRYAAYARAAAHHRRLVAAELAGAAFGVDYLIQMAQQVFRVDQMFVGLIVLGAMGFTADLLFERSVRRLLPWYGAERAERKGESVEQGRSIAH